MDKRYEMFLIITFLIVAILLWCKNKTPSDVMLLENNQLQAGDSKSALCLGSSHQHVVDYFPILSCPWCVHNSLDVIDLKLMPHRF